MSWKFLIEVAISLTFVLFIYLLLFTPLRTSRTWRATVTPLASIIGSGFLVVAPLLYFIVGDFAPLAMLLIVILAYMIGEAIRFNIIHEEPILQDKKKTMIHELETTSNLILSFAYVISVAFYLRLMSSFIMEGFFHKMPLVENIITTAVLLFIGINGFLRGLDRLENLEEYSVSVKLSVIAALLIGYLLHDVSIGFKIRGEIKPFTLETLQYLGGILLVVQGFETSKYIGHKYSPYERVRTMKLAQIISGLIYVTFILLALPLLYLLSGQKVDEAAIIGLSRHVSVILAYLLVMGAMMSQFSAAVADTIGAGGLLSVETRNRLTPRTGYLLVTLVAIVLVWSANIFEIITYASRAFAAYYLVQVIIALILARKKKMAGYQILFLINAVVLAFIVLMGKPVG